MISQHWCEVRVAKNKNKAASVSHMIIGAADSDEVRFLFPVANLIKP